MVATISEKIKNRMERKKGKEEEKTNESRQNALSDQR